MKEPDFSPGSFGYHELMDRAYVFAEMFSEHIAEHPAAKHPKLAKQIETLESALFQLYQQIGDLL
jgi:hypothetical protein